MSRRIVSAVLVTLGVAVAIHTDWHFARPIHHRLSLGLSWHWLLAVPVFALTAVYVSRTWPAELRRASAAILGIAILVGGILEPSWEYFFGGASFEWTFGAERNLALASFVCTGVVTYAVTLFYLMRKRDLSTAR